MNTCAFTVKTKQHQIFTGATRCIVGPHVKAAIEKMSSKFAGKVSTGLFR